MKKPAALLLLALLLFTGFATAILATPSTILYLLNWGEYIDTSLISEFERAYHCQVVMEIATSSEAMQQKIYAATTSYDVAIPGDYIIAKLRQEKLLRRLDVDNEDLPNLKGYQTAFADDLSSQLQRYMKDEAGVYNDCFMPYFWGAYCGMYSSRPGEQGVKEALEKEGFRAFFDRAALPPSAKVGMYDAARWIVAAYLLGQGLDPNLTSRNGPIEDDLSPALVSEIKTALSAARFSEFGNDQLKRNVATGALDLCFTQLGDFFDTLYLSLQEGKPIDFGVIVPKVTAAFFDAMVIPVTCQNYALANRFIDFMMDPAHAYQNARAIGYSPTLKAVATLFDEKAREGEYYFGGPEKENSLPLSTFLDRYPIYLNPLSGAKEAVYMLQAKSTRYLTTCETIFNSLA